MSAGATKHVAKLPACCDTKMTFQGFPSGTLESDMPYGTAMKMVSKNKQKLQEMMKPTPLGHSVKGKVEVGAE